MSRLRVSKADADRAQDGVADIDSRRRRQVSVYFQIERLRVMSGVPRHIQEVVPRLARRSSVDVKLFVPRQQATSEAAFNGVEWRDLPRFEFAHSPRAVRASWELLGVPSFEALGGRADWVYLPADGYLPVRKAALAVTIHDLYPFEKPAPGESAMRHLRNRYRSVPLYRQIARHADKILTVSHFSAGRIARHLNVHQSRIHVVYNGVSDAFFAVDENRWPALAKRFGLTEGAYVVCVGGLKPKKNTAGMIEAWSRVERLMPQASLVVVGDSRPDHLDLAKKQLRSFVALPPLDVADLAVLLRYSAALFCPSIYEGFGMPPLEAMAAGTAVIASDIAVFREIAGNAAVLVDPMNARAMADALMDVMSNKAMRDDLVRTGSEVARRFTWEACVDRIEACFAAGAT